ncbi:MAG: hypothetical protein OXI15_24675 [Chromatiales bacterium]|nr:hypothetical protein [Chromatiales bacterium]
MFARNYVTDPAYGVPFLSSSSALHAELTYADLLRAQDANSARLAPLRIEEGMTLVVRSGTIGRMTYARPEMSGMWSSEHLLKVVPNPVLVRPGYLYAFLSGRFGIPLVVGETYGAIVQHIEPGHISDLPVPLAPDGIQDDAHRLVTEAAEMRTWASAELRAVIREIEEAAGLPPLDIRYASARPDTSLVKASTLRGRMDGLFHSNYHQQALAPIHRLPENRRATVGELASRVFWPPMFKRIRVEDPRYGAPFFGTAALMRADPDASYLLSGRTSGFEDLFVDQTTVLVPASGQLNGIIGHAVLPHGAVVGGSVTHHAIRVFCRDEAVAGYLVACLSSEYARRQLKARAYGSSIPSLDESRVAGVILPRLDKAHMDVLGRRAFAARTARHDAVYKEREARALVELWIERQGAA